ncbi:unnamed protein product [Ectocarpus sp. CCAP 1310/34]|nr:unnamed protein product [Ectocarpus sp. CCAP 1310/34]
METVNGVQQGRNATTPLKMPN